MLSNLVAAVSFAIAAGAAPEYIIDTIAGTGEPGFSGDGGPAIEAQMEFPTAVAVTSDGRVYVADNINQRVRVINLDGTIDTVAGTGIEGEPSEAKAATEIDMSNVYGIATGPNDELYVLSRGHATIYRVVDGIATPIIGNGEPGYTGDGGPAIEAQIDWTNHLVVAPDGTMFLAETGNDCIRMVDTKGIITTVAGTGEPGFSVDGGPATEAQIDSPSAIAMDKEGAVYIADFDNDRIRKFTPGGNMETVAGTGVPRWNDDKLPALETNFGEPTGVAIDHEGNIIIADQVNNTIRAVTKDGICHVIGGQRRRGYTGDGGPATEARILIPDILATDAKGNIYFPDHRNHAVRVLKRQE